MKIYIADYAWAGCLVVIADSEETAREIMSKQDNYKARVPLIVRDIVPGLVHHNYGDNGGAPA